MFYNSLHRLCINNLKLLNANAKTLSFRCLKKESYQKIIKCEMLSYFHIKCENLITSLFEKGVISKNLLYHSTGYRVKENCYQKVTGELAKYFASSSPAYAYPLFKTHKLQPDHLLNAQITGIPVRLLQSAGHIPTSRFTAIIEYILHPIAVKYGQNGINEYCRDSTHYLLN